MQLIDYLLWAQSICYRLCCCHVTCFDASVGTIDIPFLDRCVGCNSHQPINVMKPVVTSSLLPDSVITKSVDLVEKLVVTFRKASHHSICTARISITTRSSDKIRHDMRYCRVNYIFVCPNEQSHERVWFWCKQKRFLFSSRSFQCTQWTKYIGSTGQLELIFRLLAVVEVFRRFRQTRTILERNSSAIAYMFLLLQRSNYRFLVQSTQYQSDAWDEHVKVLAKLSVNEINKILCHYL